MIKGCQKRVIWLRNTDSELFDEAYFILSENACKSEKNDGDMVREAKKLINSSPVCNYWGGADERRGGTALASSAPYGARTRKKAALGKGVCFLLGCLTGAAPALLLWLLRV